MPRSSQPEWRSDCPLARTLDIVGDRWTLLVIRDLALGAVYFDEFLQSPEGIASNILSQRLALLSDLGYITKEPDPDDKRRFRYSLTEKGGSLLRLIRYVVGWGLREFPDSKTLPKKDS